MYEILKARNPDNTGWNRNFHRMTLIRIDKENANSVTESEIQDAKKRFLANGGKITKIGNNGTRPIKAYRAPAKRKKHEVRVDKSQPRTIIDPIKHTSVMPDFEDDLFYTSHQIAMSVGAKTIEPIYTLSQNGLLPEACKNNNRQGKAKMWSGKVARFISYLLFKHGKTDDEGHLYITRIHCKSSVNINRTLLREEWTELEDKI